MEARVVKEKISKEELVKITKENYGNMVKVDVDIRQGVLTIGGEWHSEGQELLVNKEGSSGEDVWGVDFYPWRELENRIEYNSLINIKPAIGHREMEIKDSEIKQKMRSIIEKLLLSRHETI